MRREFYALDKLTLLEIERLFAEGAKRHEQAYTLLPVSLRRRTGRMYESVPGAVFYEIEDLVAQG